MEHMREILNKGREKKKTYFTRELADPISSGMLAIELCETSNDFSMLSLIWVPFVQTLAENNFTKVKILK